MDGIRYYIALAVLITVPPGVLYWFLIHPLIHFWRKIGAQLTFVLVGMVLALIGAGLFLVRASVLSTEFGSNSWSWLPALTLLTLAGWIEIECRRHLKFYVLAGLPEIEPAIWSSRLLEEGIYSRLRHPRYVAILVFFPALALIANYLALYLMYPLLVLAILVVVRLEERELLQRFGTAYSVYCAQVPRFFPKLPE